MDALLLLMVLIWGANYSVVKRAFEEIPPQAFNAARVAIAALVMLTVVRVVGRRGQRPGHGLSPVFFTAAPMTARDRWELLGVGLVGHFLYQFLFIGGLGRTSASNAALIIGMTPVAVAVLSSALGLERISRIHWLGAGVSLLGLYFVVVERSGDAARGSLAGDAMVAGAMICWAIYTLGSGRLMTRHSPVYVTALTMAFGGLPYAAAMLPQAVRVPWTELSLFAWCTVVFSALLALCLSYVIWYTAVQRIGAARTAIYANLVPIAAMILAVLWLHEPVSLRRALGAAGVLTGVFLTRMGRAAPPVPIEE